MSNPKVSIIIPCYNYGQFIDEAVESVLNQTYTNYEIIIVNDGSTDNFTVEKLKAYKHSKIKVLHTENQGLPFARNNGIKISDGEYIACLDADDKYDTCFIEKCVDAFESSKTQKLGIITTWIQTFGEKNELWKMSSYNPIKLMSEDDGGIHVASMFKRSCWEEIGGYPENLTKGGYEDRSFWISIISKGFKWKCVNEPLFFYRVKNSSMIHDALKRKDELFTKVIQNNLEFYKENLTPIIIHLKNLLDISLEKNKHLQYAADMYYAKKTKRLPKLRFKK